eukprot:SAG11_NODE_39075_length_241_cov_33.471831_1_plen_49_part_10
MYLLVGTGNAAGAIKMYSSGSDWLRQILTNGSNTQLDNIAILHTRTDRG